MAVRITDVIQPVDSKGLFGPESIGESAAAGDASSTQTRRSSVSKPTKTAGVSAA